MRRPGACLLSAGLAAAAVAQPPAEPDFERELPPLEAVQAPPALPEPAPAPVVPDGELAQPLSPLATFDPQPEPETPAQAAAGEAPREIPYRVDLSGLREVDLEARFRSLSSLLNDGKKAANGAQIGVRAGEDEALAVRLLRSEGYYDGSAAATVPATPAADGTVTVSLAATPGTRYRFGAVELTGLAPEPYRIARDALQLKTGDFIVAQTVEDGEARIALRLPEQGYPFVKVGQRDILLDPAVHTGDYTLPVEGGPKSVFGVLTTTGDPVFGLDHLNVFPRFKSGEMYDSRRVDDLRQALVGTDLFTSIAVEPVRTGRAGPDGTEEVDLLVRQARGPARSLSASAGYGTGEGVKLQGAWTHRNLFAPEGALIVEAIAGTLQQGLSTTFRRSNAGKRDRTFQAGVAAARQRFQAYDAETATVSASISRQSTPIWQKRWTYSAGAELIASRETPFDPATFGRPTNTFFIAALPLQIGYDLSDSLLDPTKGARVNLRVSPEAQKRSGGGFDGYARLLAEASAYQRLGSSIVLAGRARVGSIMGAPRDDIAPSRRLYAGGGGSVRGFGFQQLGPKDQNNDPIGGRSLTEFAVEARYRFGNFGVVPFVDAGRVGEGSTPSLSDMRYGAGIGGRYYTNFGPMRIDIATPLKRRPGESKVALYLSIGQAF